MTHIAPSPSSGRAQGTSGLGAPASVSLAESTGHHQQEAWALRLDCRATSRTARSHGWTKASVPCQMGLSSHTGASCPRVATHKGGGWSQCLWEPPESHPVASPRSSSALDLIPASVLSGEARGVQSHQAPAPGCSVALSAMSPLLSCLQQPWGATAGSTFNTGPGELATPLPHPIRPISHSPHLPQGAASPNSPPLSTGFPFLPTHWLQDPGEHTLLVGPNRRSCPHGQATWIK